MSFWGTLFAAFGVAPKPTTAMQAKERLQVVVSHQRRHRSSPDYLPMLEKDIMAVIAKYVAVDDDKVDIRFHRSSDISTLEVNVELPAEASGAPPSRRSAASSRADDAKSALSRSEGKSRSGTGQIELVGGKLVRKSAETV